MRETQHKTILLTMKELTVLIGDSEDDLIEFVVDASHHVNTDNSKLTFLSSYRPDEFLALARSHEIDLFVITVNNMFFGGCELSSAERIEAGLQFVSDIKTEFRKPIVAFAGFPLYPEYAEEVVAAGADRFLRLPYRLNDLRSAIWECLFDSPS